jgi:hypothetical protein
MCLKKAIRIFTLVIIGITTCSWGFLVHKSVNQLAIYKLKGDLQYFFYQNKENLVYNSVRADQRRSSDSAEATKHFIDLEMFPDAEKHGMPLLWNEAIAKYSKDSLLKYGYVPYHVIAMKHKLTEAFRSQDVDSILFYAADLGHYIADANVPLHTTVNYDGQLTDQKGMHSLWESMIPEIEMNNYDLNTCRHARYLKNPAKEIMKGVMQANELVANAFAKEKEVTKQFTDSQKYRIQVRRGKEYKSYTSDFAKAYAASLKKSINKQLLRSADMIADFWYTSWVDAGRPILTNLQSKNFTPAQMEQLNYEKKMYRKNDLIKNQLLLSRKKTSDNKTEE